MDYAFNIVSKKSLLDRKLQRYFPCVFFWKFFSFKLVTF